MDILTVNAGSLIPLGVCGLVEHICGNIGDLLIIETTTEGRHGVLSVGHLLEGAIVEKIRSLLPSVK